MTGFDNDNDYCISAEERALWRRMTGVEENAPVIEDFETLMNEQDRDPHKKSAARDFKKSELVPPVKDERRTPKSLPRKGGTDRRTEDKLRRGKMKIEARLDLHGMTQDEARCTLEGFLTNAYHNGKRVVLVITGKGRRSAETGGVLRSRLPGWLSAGALAEIVLSFHSARAQHGGEGAFYVLLRKRR